MSGQESVRPRAGARLERLDAPAARRWAMATRSAFAAHRAEIDALNVFPVPDGDTGTNLYVTLDSALEAAGKPGEQLPGSRPAARGTLADDTAALARATLLAARGNSGVILSQLIRGLSEVISTATAAGAHCDGMDGLGAGSAVDSLDGPLLARAVRRASDRAYESVTRPVQGTILSVAAAAASAAEQTAAGGADLYAVVNATLAAARVALAKTPTQLEVLAHAGVVDAGGAGYVLVLEALELVVSGAPLSVPRPQGAARLSVGALRAAAHANGSAGVGPTNGDGPGHEPGTPSYEVMYLLADTDEAAVASLRLRLDGLGDSVLVVGGEDVWNVHVHVDDVGAAIQAGIEAGRPYRIVVTHFGDRYRPRGEHRAHGPVAVVACAAGAGLAEVFRAAGAVTVFNGPGRRASAGQILDAIRACRSRCVIVLPNDGDTLLAAEAAASAADDAGLEVHVLRSRSAVQGLAALAVYEPTASGRDNLSAMSGACAATRHGAVTVAVRESLTCAGWCHPGDVLGVVDGDVVVVGKDLAEVGSDVVERLLAGGGELLTVVNGSGAGGDLAASIVQSGRAGRRDVEVNIIDGGQSTYPLLLGVE